MAAFLKDPNSVLDFLSDWTGWLAEGETIAALSVIVPTGITKDSDTHDDTSATVWLSGGSAGNTYAVTFRITTNQARTDDRTIKIYVTER